MTEKKINAPYDNPFGIWHVTTEGDCEGRSPRDLGFHEGYIDEIALALADKCFYSLYFVAINTQVGRSPSWWAAFLFWPTCQHVRSG